MEQKTFSSYVYDCFQWYTYEYIGKFFVDTLGNIFHVNFLGYSYWFISMRISHMKGHSILVDQARYSTYIVDKYLDTVTVNTSKTIYKTTLTSNMIFTNAYTYTSDQKVKKFTRAFNIHYRACIGSLIYLLSTRLDFIFAVKKLAIFSSNPGEVNFEGVVHLLIYIGDNHILGLNYYSDIKYEYVSDLLRQSIIKTQNQLV